MKIINMIVLVILIKSLYAEWIKNNIKFGYGVVNSYFF